MASEEKPKEEAAAAEGEGGAEEKKSGGSKLPIILGAVNMLAVLGLGAMFVLGKGKEEEDPKDKAKKKPAEAAAAAAGEHADKGHGEAADGHGEAADGHGEDHGEAADGHGEAADGHGAAGDGHAVATTLVGLGVFLINLDEPGEQRFLKCKIAVEVEGEGEVKKATEGKISKIRYEVNMLLSGLRVADVSGPEKIEQLRKVMIKRARKAVAPEIKVVGMWPEEWIVN